MKAFLTSTLGGHETVGDTKYPAAIWNPNGLKERLVEALPEKVRCLIIASDPGAHEINDFYMSLDSEGLRLSGINLESCRLCDSRNAGDIGALLSDCDLVILSGGHVPTEHEFFRRIGLKERLEAYTGVVVGISAGSMNSCELIYCQPELPGEASDPDFLRWREGMGIVKLSLLPHWQEISLLTLDGFRVFEDISLPDSREHPFYALCDGSYILCEDGHADIFGEAYLLSDGEIHQVCSVGEKRRVY